MSYSEFSQYCLAAAERAEKYGKEVEFPKKVTMTPGLNLDTDWERFTNIMRS
jgi:hypothetical protein